MNSVVGFADAHFDHPRYSRLHDSVRELHVRVSAPFLEKLLRNQCRIETLRLETRHSVRVPGMYRIFRSDLDISAVISEAEPREKIGSLVRQFESLRRKILFLGELEIYTEAEWRLKIKANSLAPEFLRLIWQLRKWKWQEEPAPAKDLYHQRKREKSLNQIFCNITGEANGTRPSLKKVESVLQRFLSDLLGGRNRAGQGLELSGTSNFLGWSFSANPEANEKRTLCLPSELIILLAAMLPDGEEIFPGHFSLLESYRHDPQVAEPFSALVLNELMISRSVTRTSIDPQAKTWQAGLAGLLARYAPELHADFLRLK